MSRGLADKKKKSRYQPSSIQWIFMARLPVTVLLLCLCSVGFCCNKGWYHFLGKCYTKSLNMYDTTMAKRYCQMSKGDLARVTSKEMLRFLGNMPNFDGMNEYWVAEDSSLADSAITTGYSVTLHETEDTQPPTSSTLCSYVKILELKLEYCSEKKYFICETEYPEISNICPANFDYYGDNCYRAITNPPANFDDASRFCSLQNSHLAILDKEEKEWEAKAALMGRNETFLVSAQKGESGIAWTNGERFSPVHEVFANYSDGGCIAYVSDADQPMVFSWLHVDCEKKYSYLCESAPLLPKEVGSTSTTVAATTLSSLECPHGYNWKPHEESGFCFWETTYETERLNWFQARNFCKLYGGDLASYNNEEQEIAGLGGARGHYRGLWIGLKRDEFTDVFYWSDGNVLNFTNWAMDEPNMSSDNKFCVTHTSGTSQWGLDYCGVRRWFICKAPKVRNPAMPDMPTEKKPRCEIKDSSSVYRNQWYEYENHCYLIQERSKYTWDTARYFCQDNGAHLMSVHSFEETNFILSTITGYPESNFWIGLSSPSVQDTFQWSDNSPLDFLYWSDTRSEIKDFNTCITFNKRDGSWDVEHCNRLQAVICKRGVNSSYDFTSTEPTTIMPGNCENGWYNMGNKCYKFFGSLWSQRLSWSLAKTECENLGASLVSIHNKEEQEFLTDIVLEGFTNVWIGLQALDGGSVFHWNDETRMDYTNWNANEPNGYHGDIDLLMGSNSVDFCVEMEYGESGMGRWNVIRCSETRAYICQKMKDPTNTGPYIDPFTCPNITGWSKLGSSCYEFFEHYNMTWMEAQRECKKHSANLVSYGNAAVSIFVKRKLKLKNAYFWSGAREKTRDTYEYVTGQALFYTNWMVDQPQVASTVLDNCVATTADGEWLVRSCKEKHPFICQTGRESEPEPKVDRSHTCLNVSQHWKDFGGNYCYLIETSMKLTWVESMYYCYRHGGQLASFHSADEVEKVRKKIPSYGPSALHIGLMRQKGGALQWVDKSPIDFSNWEDEESRQSSAKCAEMSRNGDQCKECVEMNIYSGKWNDINCDDHYLGFICSSLKVRVSSDDPFIEGDPEDDSEYGDPKMKLVVGGIFGFVLCFLVIVAIVALIIYYLRHKNEVAPKLLEQDNL